jgi:hypothetical protein
MKEELGERVPLYIMEMIFFRVIESQHEKTLRTLALLKAMIFVVTDNL